MVTMNRFAKPLYGAMRTVALGLLCGIIQTISSGEASGEAVIDTTLIQECVVMLQPVYEGKHEQYLATLRKALGQRGYRTAQDLLEDYVWGGFLSGVVVDWSGKKYVLTSRHGLAMAQYVEVERHGGKERVGRCEIVYSRGPTDLAVIALPPDYTGSGFPLDIVTIGQESELLVAGYMGFGGEPQWWLEREHRLLRIRTRGDNNNSKGTSIIEHDALLDPGMTGSALLVAESGGDTGFSLLGINIWKATLYENRSEAVFVGEVIDLLQQLNKTDDSPFEGEQLVVAINEGGAALASYLSDAYIASVPVERVFAEYDHMERSERRRVASLFNAGEAVEGVRLILAHAIQRGYAGAYTRVVTEGHLHELVNQGNRMPLIVTHEYGGWRINELQLPSLPEKVHYGLANMVTMRGTARIGVTVPFYSKEGIGGTLQFSYMQWTYVFFRIDGVYGRYGFEENDPMTDAMIEVEGAYLGLAPSLGIQLPVMLNEVLLLPYIRGFYGMHYSLRSKQANFQFFRTYRAVPGFGFGLDVSCQVSRDVYIVGGVSGQYVVISSNFGGKRTRGMGLEVSVGVGF